MLIKHINKCKTIFILFITSILINTYAMIPGKDCGRCNEKGINGKCCEKGIIHDDELCWCTCQNGLDCGLYEFCIGYWCVQEEPNKNCGDCNKYPIDGRCCGSSVHGHDGRCFCGNNGKCEGDNECPNNKYVCCKNTHYCHIWKGNWRNTCGS